MAHRCLCGDASGLRLVKSRLRRRSDEASTHRATGEQGGLRGRDATGNLDADLLANGGRGGALCHRHVIIFDNLPLVKLRVGPSLFILVL